MLSFRLHAPDLTGNVLTGPHELKVGKGFLRPFSHPRLEYRIVATPDHHKVLALVRERMQPDWYLPLQNMPVEDGIGVFPEKPFKDFLRAVRQWPLDFTAVLFDMQNKRLEITAGPLGSAPVYLLHRENRLFVDWDVTRLYPYLSAASALDPDRALLFLSGRGAEYSRRTMFKDIWCLTAGATASWHPASNHFEVRYPEPEYRPEARELKPGADALGAFQELLSALLERQLGTDFSRVGAALSGGLDSAIVAASASELAGGDLRTYGILMTGPTRSGQVYRRNAMIARCGFLDSAVDALDHLPFSDDSDLPRNGCFVPWEEYYYLAMTALYRKARQHGLDTYLTGIGGDELFMLAYHEWPSVVQETVTAQRRNARHSYPSFLSDLALRRLRSSPPALDPAPPGLVSDSARDFGVVHGSLFLRHGIWPAHPLATPEMAGFCAQLPAALRKNRKLQRDFLVKLGLARDVVYPRTTETFSDVMTRGFARIARPRIESLFNSSRLADLGWIDPGKLQAAYRSYCDHPEDRPVLPLLAAANLETTLRVIEKTRGEKAP
ncbi:MAG: asparagine synthase-related protein [Acidobacteriota bacterium]|nr:asparagine synthase-related protein [Acidobacteriota bacterium]